MTDAKKKRAIQESLSRYQERIAALERSADMEMDALLRKVRAKRLAEIRSGIKTHAK